MTFVPKYSKLGPFNSFGFNFDERSQAVELDFKWLQMESDVLSRLSHNFIEWAHIDGHCAVLPFYMNNEFLLVWKIMEDFYFKLK